MKEQIKKDIIDTLSYFDVFNYSPTLHEICLFLHNSSSSKKLVKECIDEVQIIDKNHGYYSFSNRKNLSIKRRIVKKENIIKIGLALNYAKLLKFIPGVKLIALTGSVSMKNALEDDDIDIFIITRKNMLWTTRLMLIFLTKLFGIKREYKKRKNKNKLCLNMFLDETNLEINEKNIYTAHEIVQIKVLYDEKNMYEKFLNSNLWVFKYLPNLTYKKGVRKRDKRWFDSLLFSEKILSFVNLLAFVFQYIYMIRKITKEQISLTKAFFYPHKSSSFIKQEYEKRKNIYIQLDLLARGLGKLKIDQNLGKKIEVTN